MKNDLMFYRCHPMVKQAGFNTWLGKGVSSVGRTFKNFGRGMQQEGQNMRKIPNYWSQLPERAWNKAWDFTKNNWGKMLGVGAIAAGGSYIGNQDYNSQLPPPQIYPNQYYNTYQQ